VTSAVVEVQAGCTAGKGRSNYGVPVEFIEIRSFTNLLYSGRLIRKFMGASSPIGSAVKVTLPNASVVAL
jgi:hypothetical protein